MPDTETADTEKVSVISVTYYTGPALFDMIRSVLKQARLQELILVNNGNPLSVFHQLEDMADSDPRIKLVSGHSNVGFSTANNLGAQEATGEYLLLLNPDCTLGDHFLQRMVEEAKNLPRPLLIGSRVLDENGHEQSGSRRDVLTPWKAFVEVFSLYKIAPNHPYFRRWKLHENSLPDHIISVPAISGAVMFLPRDDYWKINGFDESFFLHVEDVDLCFRFREAGGRIYFHPGLSVTHIGATSAAPKTLVEWHKTRSFVRYFKKNFSSSYPKPFLWLVNAAIWLRFFVQAACNTVHFGKTGLKSRG